MTGSRKKTRSTASRKKSKNKTDELKQYTHAETKRRNNPQAGLVDNQTDPDQSAKKYRHDPRLDPQLQWSGKIENSEFEVDTVSLHVHERIDPHTILEKALKPKQHQQQTIPNFFDTAENNPPLRDAVEFYKHEQGWSNRLIAGDSLLVMNSLLEKEGMEGKVQMIYIDPPYGIKYGSNFQPFVSKKTVTDGKDEDLTQEPEMIKAFRDTWELGIHSYLSYIKDRLFLARKLLNDTGSCFVQISRKNLHYVRCILDEVFGPNNFKEIIAYRTKTGFTNTDLPNSVDYIVWYTKNNSKATVNKLYMEKEVGADTPFEYLEYADGTRKPMSTEMMSGGRRLPKDSRIYQLVDLTSTGMQKLGNYKFTFKGKKYSPAPGRGWIVDEAGMKELIKKRRLVVSGNTIRYVYYYDDFPFKELTNIWMDSQGAQNKKYVVQTASKII